MSVVIWTPSVHFTAWLDSHWKIFTGTKKVHFTKLFVCQSFSVFDFNRNRRWCCCYITYTKLSVTVWAPSIHFIIFCKCKHMFITYSNTAYIVQINLYRWIYKIVFFWCTKLSTIIWTPSIYYICKFIWNSSAFITCCLIFLYNCSRTVTANSNVNCIMNKCIIFGYIFTVPYLYRYIFLSSVWHITKLTNSVVTPYKYVAVSLQYCRKIITGSNFDNIFKYSWTTCTCTLNNWFWYIWIWSSTVT